MVLVDRRMGSAEFLNPIRHLGASATLDTLAAADFAFTGNGPDGPVVIGIERKTVPDLIESMRGRRLSGHQVRLLSSCYDLQFLIVEGQFRPNPETHILESRTQDWGKWYTGFGKPIHYGEIASYLIGLDANGIPVMRTGNEIETAAWVVWLYKYYQKEWTSHTSLRSIYSPPPSRPAGKMSWEAPSEVAKVAAVIPGLDQKAWEVAKVFTTPREMFTAPPEKWMIAGPVKNGRKTTVVGKVMVERIQGWMDGKAK